MRNFGIVFLVLAAMAAAALQPTRITVVGGLTEASVLSLKAASIKATDDDSSCGLEIWPWQKQQAVKALTESYLTLEMSVRLVEENIANVDTTRTAEGTPYRRRHLALDSEGRPAGVGEDHGDFFWSYEPAHPEACPDGPRQGYLARPNINLAQERSQLHQLREQQRALREILRELDPSIVFSADPSVEYLVSDQPSSGDMPARLSFAGLSDLSLRSVSQEDLRRLRPRGAEGFQSEWMVSRPEPMAAGQVCVANALNWLYQERRYSAEEIDAGYGFGLLNALKGETAALGIDWFDAGNLGPESWQAIERTLSQDLPALVAYRDLATGSEEGAAGDRIALLLEIQGDQVLYADPITGEIRSMSRQTLMQAPDHSDGNFVFLPGRPDFLQTYDAI
jgi:flagellar basal body rod protein FlgC